MTRPSNLDVPIQYCTTSDGVRIGYAVAGDGPPIVVVLGWINPIQYQGANELTYLTFARYLDHFRVIRFDKRGTGASDRDVTDLSVDARLRDLEAVVAATDLDRFRLYGHSEGGSVAPTTLVSELVPAPPPLPARAAM